MFDILTSSPYFPLFFFGLIALTAAATVVSALNHTLPNGCRTRCAPYQPTAHITAVASLSTILGLSAHLAITNPSLLLNTIPPTVLTSALLFLLHLTSTVTPTSTPPLVKPPDTPPPPRADPPVITTPPHSTSTPPPVPPEPDTGPLELRIKKQRDTLAAHLNTIAALKEEASKLKQESHNSITNSVEYSAGETHIKGASIKAFGCAAMDPAALLKAIPSLPPPSAPNGPSPRALTYEPDDPAPRKAQPVTTTKAAKTMAELVAAKTSGGEGGERKVGAQGSGEVSKRDTPVTPKPTSPPLPSILPDNNPSSPSGPLAAALLRAKQTPLPASVTRGLAALNPHLAGLGPVAIINPSGHAWRCLFYSILASMGLQMDFHHSSFIMSVTAKVMAAIIARFSSPDSSVPPPGSPKDIEWRAWLKKTGCGGTFSFDVFVAAHQDLKLALSGKSVGLEAYPFLFTIAIILTNIPVTFFYAPGTDPTFVTSAWSPKRNPRPNLNFLHAFVLYGNNHYYSLQLAQHLGNRAVTSLPSHIIKRFELINSGSFSTDDLLSVFSNSDTASRVPTSVKQPELYNAKHCPNVIDGSIIDLCSDGSSDSTYDPTIKSFGSSSTAASSSPPSITLSERAAVRFESPLPPRRPQTNGGEGGEGGNNGESQGPLAEINPLALLTASDLLSKQPGGPQPSASTSSPDAEEPAPQSQLQPLPGSTAAPTRSRAQSASRSRPGTPSKGPNIASAPPPTPGRDGLRSRTTTASTAAASARALEQRS